MNKRVRKIISLCLCTMLTAAFMTSCKSKVSEPVKEKVPVVTEKDKPLTFDMYLNYSWWAINTPFDTKNKISKWIIDNKGVTINYKWASGNEKEKLNLMLATDDLPDVIVMERDDMYKKMVSMGSIVPLDDYIKKYSGYKNTFSEETINLSKENGKVYGMLNWANTKEWLGFGTAPMINEKIYKQLGSPKLDTLDDLVAYLDKVKKSNIKVDGKSIVPLQYKAGEADGSYFLSAWGENRLSGEFMTNRPVKNGQLGFVMNDPKYPEFAAFVNKLYRDGYVNKDAFVEKQDQVNEKLSTGRVAVYMSTDASNQVGTAMQALKKSGSDTTYSYIAAPAAAGVDKNSIVTIGKSTLGWNVVAITKKAKDPEKIYKYLDWLISQEGQRVTLFGPKGELWDSVDADGYPILKAGKTLALSEDDAKLLPLQTFAIPAQSPFYDKAKIKMNKGLPENLKDWSVSQQDNSNLNKYTYDVTQFNNIGPDAGTNEATINADVRDYVKDQLTKMVMAKSQDEALKIMNDTLTQVYKKGYDKVEKVANTKWVENKKQMGIK